MFVGINRVLTYSVTGGDKENCFTVNPSTGVIYTAKPLNREQQAYYNLAVTATDHASPQSMQLSSTAMVRITEQQRNYGKICEYLYQEIL